MSEETPNKPESTGDFVRPKNVQDAITLVGRLSVRTHHPVVQAAALIGLMFAYAVLELRDAVKGHALHRADRPTNGSN